MLFASRIRRAVGVTVVAVAALGLGGTAVAQTAQAQVAPAVYTGPFMAAEPNPSRLFNSKQECENYIYWHNLTQPWDPMYCFPYGPGGVHGAGWGGDVA